MCIVRSSQEKRNVNTVNMTFVFSNHISCGYIQIIDLITKDLLFGITSIYFATPQTSAIVYAIAEKPLQIIKTPQQK